MYKPFNNRQTATLSRLKYGDSRIEVATKERIKYLSFGFNINLEVKKLQKLSLRFAQLEVKADSGIKRKLRWHSLLAFNSSAHPGVGDNFF